MTNHFKKLVILGLSVPLAACVVGPYYVPPEAIVSSEFKEVVGWKAAQPQDHVLPTNWWEVFHDTNLNALEEQIASANQSILQAQAQYHQAQHLLQSAQSVETSLL
jgi:outer membrane protein TolC